MFFNFHIAYTIGPIEQTQYLIEESGVGRSGQPCDRNWYRKKVLNNDRHNFSDGF